MARKRDSVVVTSRISLELHEKLERLVRISHRTRSDLIQSLIEKATLEDVIPGLGSAQWERQLEEMS